MSWYRTGTVAVTNGSTAVTGTGTAWVANVLARQGIILPDGRVYEIATIVSNTAITLATAYQGSTAAGQSYAILPTRGPELVLAQQIASLIAAYGAAFEGAGQGLFGDGSAAAPGIRFSADQNTGLRRTGADAMALVTNGVDRLAVTNAGAVLSGLLTGTAVTQNPTDTTAGRLMTVGYQGLGAPAVLLAGSTLLKDRLLPTGFYAYNSGTVTDGPEGSVSWVRSLSVIEIPSSLVGGGNPRRIYLDTRSSSVGVQRMWLGANQGTDPIVWREIYTSGSLLGQVSQVAGLPTGAVIERGSNANGEFLRLADGTQMCWRTLTGATGAGVSWSFPAVFVAAPVVTGSAIATVQSAVVLDAAPSATACTLSARGSDNARRADVMHLAAVGRWF